MVTCILDEKIQRNSWFQLLSFQLQIHWPFGFKDWWLLHWLTCSWKRSLGGSCVLYSRNALGDLALCGYTSATGLWCNGKKQIFHSIPFYPWKPRKLVGIWTTSRKSLRKKHTKPLFLPADSTLLVARFVMKHFLFRDAYPTNVIGWFFSTTLSRRWVVVESWWTLDVLTRWKMFQPPMPWIYDLRGMDDLTKFYWGVFFWW